MAHVHRTLATSRALRTAITLSRRSVSNAEALESISYSDNTSYVWERIQVICTLLHRLTPRNLRLKFTPTTRETKLHVHDAYCRGIYLTLSPVKIDRESRSRSSMLAMRERFVLSIRNGTEEGRVAFMRWLPPLHIKRISNLENFQIQLGTNMHTVTLWCLPSFANPSNSATI